MPALAVPGAIDMVQVDEEQVGAVVLVLLHCPMHGGLWALSVRGDVHNLVVEKVAEPTPVIDDGDPGVRAVAADLGEHAWEPALDTFLRGHDGAAPETPVVGGDAVLCWACAHDHRCPVG